MMLSFVMNKLGIEIKETYREPKMDYKEVWKDLAKNKAISIDNVIELALIKAVKAKNSNNATKEEIALGLLQKSFTPITNKTKLANGRWAFDALHSRLWYLSHNSKFNLLGVNTGDLLTAEEVIELINLIKGLLKVPLDEFTEILTREYVFTFVRQDISKEQQLVQAGHALYKLGNILNSKKADNTHFVVIGVPDLAELKKTVKHVGKHVEYAHFIEPDIGNQMTAFSTFPVPKAKKHLFSQYELLKFAS